MDIDDMIQEFDPDTRGRAANVLLLDILNAMNTRIMALEAKLEQLDGRVDDIQPELN